MIRDSLRLRLLAGGAVAIAAALALAWLAMTLIFARHIEARVEADLQRQAVPLLAVLQLAPNHAPAVEADLADPRFEAPAGGLYWQASNGFGAQRSRSLWDSSLPLEAAPDSAWHSRRVDGPFGQHMLIVARNIRPDRAGPAVLVQIGYDLAQLDSARREFGQEMGGFLALLWLVLSGAAWVQVSLGLRPLVRVRREVARLSEDPAARLAGHYPRELKPLTHAIDALADAREADLERARRRAADLAHGLKTPLAAAAAQSRRAREAGATAAAEGLDQAIHAMRGAIDGELARNRVGLVRGEVRRVAAAELIERLVGVLEHTEAGERIAFSIQVAPGTMLPLSPEDATDMLGPLIENAATHARRQVRVSAEGAMVAVADDGPGIAEERRGEALLRGERLDSAGAGHGLGLAIARDLAEASGGILSLLPSDLGGLEVRIEWHDAPVTQA